MFKTSCISESCSSSDGLQLYQEDGKIRGHCFVCKASFFDIDLENMKEIKPTKHMEQQAPRRTVQWVLENSTERSIDNRALPLDILKEYGIRVGIDPATGEIDRHFYPIYTGETGDLVGYKERKVTDKSFVIHGTGKGAGLFGQKRAGSGGKMLIVTEGELDAVAATVMLRQRNKNYRVVSLPNGASAKAIADNIEWIETFENVFLALDQDPVGIQCASDIADILTPGKVKLMKFSEKDPCDMLMSGKSSEFFNAVFNAQEYRPDGIVGVDDIFDEAIKPVEWGLSWPWESLTKATYGYRRAEIYGFGAGSGCGKTEGFKEIIDHVIHHHHLPAGVIFLEEPVAKTLKVLAGKRFNKRFHIPDGDWTVDELVEGINGLRGKVYLYNHFGSKSWENIKSKIKYMVRSLGIKDIFLDHLTALVAQEADEYKALNKIMEEMASLVQELDCTIFYISHLRKAQGTPHEEGGHVSADQFKGSGAIVFWSNFLFGYERNQQAEDDMEKNTTLFRVLKDRNTGLSTGLRFNLLYDHKTGRMREFKPEERQQDYGDVL